MPVTEFGHGGRVFKVTGRVRFSPGEAMSVRYTDATVTTAQRQAVNVNARSVDTPVGRHTHVE